MGHGYRVKCTNCEYNYGFWVGLGMTHSPERVFYGDQEPYQKWTIDFPDKIDHWYTPSVLGLVSSNKIARQVYKLMTQGYIPSRVYGLAEYVCPHCNLLYHRFYFRLSDQTENPKKKKYTPKYECPRCRSILKPIKFHEHEGILTVLYLNNKNAKWECPKCGNPHLMYDKSKGEILWD